MIKLERVVSIILRHNDVGSKSIIELSKVLARSYPATL